jgi:hypothetical protein
MRRTFLPFIAAALGVLAALTGDARAGLLNGDFSSTPGTGPDAFANWTTTSSEGPTNGGGFAVFTESATGDPIELEQTFVLPGNASKLSFDFLISPISESVPGSPPDGFQATLFVNSVNPFPSPANSDLPAFYSTDNTGFNESFDPNFVRTTLLENGWTRVTLDLSSLPSPQSVLLEFDLNTGFNGQTTTAFLDNVDVTVADVSAVPEPSTLVLFAASFGCLALAQRRSTKHNAANAS